MSLKVRLLPCGERAVLAEIDDTGAPLAGVLALAAAVRSRRGTPGWPVVDVVPAARTVLVTVTRPAHLATVVRGLYELADTVTAEDLPSPTRTVTIEVVYDGPDLAEVARLTGLSPAEVVDAHTGTPWQVAFGGFAPVFAYLVGGDPRLEVPRRGEPRTRVPAGAVGLAGTFSGIYPRPSPGGWQLLGHTTAVLWDPSADPPALLSPGTAVRFSAVHSRKAPG
jgi:KipI family sensor histidine kinase inhibitor